MVKSVISKKTKVFEKSLSGKGTFAIEDIKKGEMIYIRGGHLLTKKEIFHYTNEDCPDGYWPITDEYWLGATNEEEFKLQKVYVNHSCNANCGIRGEITVVAMRDIKKGEEITQDYGLLDDNDYSFKCTCGSDNCRKVITGKDWKLKELQDKYYDYFASYLREKIKNVVVTSGSTYIDIDAYAGCIAYAILLRALNIPAKAVTTSLLNESIPNLIKKINLSFEEYIPTANDEFIILDVSNPDMFDNIVRMDKIIRIIDHHTGYEDFWKEKEINKEIDKSEIEFIGSVCTIIYEKFVELNKTGLLTKDLCKLLTAGILDNTLNLKANITTKRDIKAYNELVKFGKLSNIWAKEYFSACEEEILKDLKSAIINDIKNTKENINLPDVFGQLTIYNSNKTLEQVDLIKSVFSDYSEWMINIISLKDGKSYIITDSKKSKQDLEKLFGKKFEGDILILDKFMLRKEIIKKANELL